VAFKIRCRASGSLVKIDPVTAELYSRGYMNFYSTFHISGNIGVKYGRRALDSALSSATSFLN
jgi:hypothetical protein